MMLFFFGCFPPIDERGGEQFCGKKEAEKLRRLKLDINLQG